MMIYYLERPDTPMSTGSASSSMTLDLDMSVSNEPQSQPSDCTEKKTVDRQLSSRTLTPSPLTLETKVQHETPEIEEEEEERYSKVYLE